MKRILFLSIFFLLSFDSIFATQLSTGIEPKNALIGKGGNGWGLVELLRFAEEFLLKVALPLVIIGTALYIAYELFTAE